MNNVGLIQHYFRMDDIMKNNFIEIEKKDLVFISVLYAICIVIFILLVITVSNQKKTVTESLNNSNYSEEINSNSIYNRQ